jgi:hypothetical protein
MVVEVIASLKNSGPGRLVHADGRALPWTHPTQRRSAANVPAPPVRVAAERLRSEQFVTPPFAITVSSPVDPLLTVCLLEAVRHLDQPEHDLDAEYVQELRNKRFGLSDTVFAQIKRYHEQVRRNIDVPREEAGAICRLLGRRADADAVFRAGGQRLARASFATLSPFSRGLLSTLPGMFARPIALGHLRRLCARYLNARVTRVGGFVFLAVDDAVAADNEQGDVGAVFYEAVLREYVALLVGGSGAVERTRASADRSYEWRAEWRAATSAERRAMRAAAARS